jgi:hypothetical protein
LNNKNNQIDETIKNNIGKASSSSLDELDPDVVTPEYKLYQDDFEGTHLSVPDIDDVTPEDMDNYVGAEVSLPIGGDVQIDKVKRMVRDPAGDIIGKANTNPLLDTRMY